MWRSRSAPLALLALLALALPASQGAQAPCLEGRRGQTSSEILRDDWACYKFCRNQGKLSATCDLCCPTWLGGSGNNVPVDESTDGGEDPAGMGHSTTTTASASSSVGTDSVTKTTGGTTAKGAKTTKEPSDGGSTEASEASSGADAASSSASPAETTAADSRR